MRLLIYLRTLLFLSSCTTIEVTKEVVKVGNVVKDKVEKQFEIGGDIVEDKTIVDEQQIIIEKKEEEETIVETQKKLSQINFIGKSINEIEEQMGDSNLVRSDGMIQTLRYDSDNCRLFLFFNLDAAFKRVEHFEFRNLFGELLDTRNSLESCYKEYNLIN